MKIIAKFAFVVLVTCFIFIMMGAVKAKAQECDSACEVCMQDCGNTEALCLEGCGDSGGPTCLSECQAEFEGCSTECLRD